MTQAELLAEERAKHQAEVSRERDRKDQEDIRTLRNTVAFDRFFMRRIGEKKQTVEKAFRHDPMTHEQREIKRQILDLYEEIEGLLASDESTIQRNLSSRQ